MNEYNTFQLLTVFVIVFAIVIPIASFSGDAETSLSIEEAKIVSEQGLEFAILFDDEKMTVSIRATNKGNHGVSHSSLNIAIDGNYIYETSFNLSRNGEWARIINISDGLNVLSDKHIVTVSTVGAYTEFNFTKDVNISNSSTIPTPHIDEVTIKNGTIDGEPSAVAKVTVVNPSIHPYPLKLMVHTTGTDGSFYGASVAPGGKDTITVELLDERGTQIAGEARLYAGNLSKGDGAMDQVGFVGRAGEDTKTWNETYEPIKGPWRSDGYEYHNATYEDDTSLAEQLSAGQEIFGIPIIYVVSGLVVGLVMFRRIG